MSGKLTSSPVASPRQCLSLNIIDISLGGLDFASKRPQKIENNHPALVVFKQEPVNRKGYHRIIVPNDIGQDKIIRRQLNPGKVNSRSPSSSKGRRQNAPAGEDSDNIQGTSDNFNPQPIRGRLPGVICYICGRNYGTASLDIHEKTCLKRWKEENEQLPKNMQRPIPVKPQMISKAPENAVKGAAGGKYDLDAFNDAAFQSAQDQYVPCSKCGRTFLPDRLGIHEKNCRGRNKKG